MPGEYDVGGTAALYERVGDLETIRIPGPLRDGILIYVSMSSGSGPNRAHGSRDAVVACFQVIFRGRARNPGLRYQYTVRRPGVLPPSRSWRWTDWSSCSATCGGGHQELRAVCTSGDQHGGQHGGQGQPGQLDQALQTLPDEECELAVGPRPPDKTRTCANHACPAT